MQITTTDFRKNIFKYGNLVYTQKKKITVSKSGIPYFDITPHQEDTFTFASLAGVLQKPDNKKFGKMSMNQIRKLSYQDQK